MKRTTHLTKNNVRDVIVNSPGKRQLGGLGPPDAILAIQDAAADPQLSELLRCALDSHETPSPVQRAKRGRRPHLGW